MPPMNFLHTACCNDFVDVVRVRPNEDAKGYLCVNPVEVPDERVGERDSTG